jgi:threonine dehydrogenase-like Zn-dependent dehydrogenase
MDFVTEEHRQVASDQNATPEVHECCGIVRNIGDVHKWSNGRAVIQETSAAVQ